MQPDEYDAMVARDMHERVLQARVEQMARATGWLFYHTHRSDRSPAGFPDLVLLRQDRLIFAELKSQKGRVQSAQTVWLDKLRHLASWVRHVDDPASAPIRRLPVEVFLWRPTDLLDGTIERALI